MDEDVKLRTRLLQLRALRIVDTEGWARYIAGDLVADRHALQLDNGYRLLEPGEAWWWSQGIADGYGYGYLLTDLGEEPAPELLTLGDAAALLPQGQRSGDAMTLRGAEHLIKSGQLYTVHAGRTRYVFRAQVDALAAARIADRHPGDLSLRARAVQLQEAWAGVRALYPPATRLVDLAEQPVPHPSPDPLPIRDGLQPRRRRAALLAGHDEGWFDFRQPVTTGTGRVTGYTVVIGRGEDAVERLLPPGGVLPWVLGVADYYGQSKLVAYRDGLG
jgi:hypothetical protein